LTNNQKHGIIKTKIRDKKSHKKGIDTMTDIIVAVAVKEEPALFTADLAREAVKQYREKKAQEEKLLAEKILANILDQIKAEAQKGKTSCTIARPREESEGVAKAIVDLLKTLDYRVQYKTYNSYPPDLFIGW
jgi:glycyl-tRNA synthetase beta subunit